MKRFGLSLAICAFTIVGYGSPTEAIADNLDSRLAELEKKNLDLKKMLRIEALEKENRALSRKLSVPVAHETIRDAAVAVEKATREPSVYDARAAYYPTKSEPLSAPGPRYVVVPDVRAPQWAGPYLGLHAGMGFSKWPTSISNVGITNGQAVTFAAASTNSNALGGLAGLHAGYLWQIGAFVFGPELDLDVSTVGSKSTIPTNFSQDFGGSSFSETFSNANSATLKWLSTFRGRVALRLVTGCFSEQVASPRLVLI